MTQPPAPGATEDDTAEESISTEGNEARKRRSEYEMREAAADHGQHPL